MEDIVNNLIEITFEEKDDFFKIRETLTRIGVALEKKKNYFNHVTYFTKR